MGVTASRKGVLLALSDWSISSGHLSTTSLQSLDVFHRLLHTRPADSRTLLTACDDMHVNLYDVENASMIESFSGENKERCPQPAEA